MHIWEDPYKWMKTEEGREFELESAENVWSRQASEEDLHSREEDSSNAWRRISSQYAKYDDAGHADVATDDTTVDMSSANQRLNTLNLLTQNSATAPEGSVRDRTCAASSLVGAAMVADGTDGLLALMDGMDASASEEFQKQLASMEAKGGDLYNLREKIAKGEKLNFGDLHRLQMDLNSELHYKDDEINGKRDRAGVNTTAEQAFIDGSPEFAAMMKLHHLHIDNVDTDGDGASNHAVLNIGDKLVYDPWMRNGGQIVSNEADVRDYRMAHLSTADGDTAMQHWAD